MLDIVGKLNVNSCDVVYYKGFMRENEEKKNNFFGLFVISITTISNFFFEEKIKTQKR